jgi:hypothetical protein
MKRKDAIMFELFFYGFFFIGDPSSRIFFLGKLN